MDTDNLAAKREKSRKYATEPQRFSISEMQLIMRSEHDVRHIRFKDQKWLCTCEFFAVHGTCSHTMAAELLFQAFINP